MAADKSDEQLLRAFVGGDRQALAGLAQRYERALLGVSRGLLGGRDDLACDAVQATWLRVVRFGGSFDGRSRFKTWLYRIAMNECRSLLAARPPTADSAPHERQPGADADAGADPPQAAQRNDLRQQVSCAVEQLPADRRAVLLLCYHSGMTHEQAAEILEIPLGTLKSRLHAALQELRQRLSSETTS